jgi:hypothetical protein
MMIKVDNSGNCFPYYWLNPADGILAYDSPNWTLIAIDNTQINTTIRHEIFFSTGTTVSVPEPSTILLLGFGLSGLAGIRRKFRSYMK